MNLDRADRRENYGNAVRLLLAWLVLFSHCFELIDRGREREPLVRLFRTVTAGDLAVDGFFLLSGFLVLQSWARDPHPLRYLARRALRIYPGFAAATLLSGFVLGPLFGGGPSVYFSRFDPVRFLQATILLREPGVPPVFVGLPYEDPNGSLWTIQYEFQCYLLVAVAGAAGLAERRTFWATVGLGALAFHVVRPDALEGIRFPASRLFLGDSPGSFLRFLAFFCTGAFGFLVRDRLRRDPRWAAVAAVVLVGGLFEEALAKSVLPFAGGYLLFWTVFAPVPSRGWLSAVQRFTSRTDLSYGTYLYGWPVQQILIRLLAIRSPWKLLPLATAAVLPVAAASWRWIERPALSRKPAPPRTSARAEDTS